MTGRAGLRFEVRAALTALQTFTRLPVPAWVGWSPAQARASVRYLPWIGVLVGTVAAGVFEVARRGWPVGVAVLLSMAATLLLTGAMHEDGLADTADGLGGGGPDRTKVLAILQDPRVGSFGVIALVIALGLKFQLLAALPPRQFVAASIAAHTLSRCSTLWVMARLPYLRDDGPSKSRPMAARRLSMPAFGFGALAGLGACAGLAQRPWVALAAASVTVLCAALAVHGLRRRLGGYVGDTLGAAQQCTELAVLAVCLAAVGPASNG